MPTPSLPSSDSRESRVSIRSRSTNAATATSSAADEALLYVLDRKLRKREGRLPPPRRQAEAMISGESRPPVHAARLGGWLIPGLVLTLVAGAVTAGAVAIASAGRSSHAISGVLLLGSKPVPAATVSFIPASGTTTESLALTTSPEGRFRTADDRPLASGMYSVVVETRPNAGNVTPTAIPAIYRDAATTPLRVVVTEDLSDLRLLIRR